MPIVMLYHSNTIIYKVYLYGRLYQINGETMCDVKNCNRKVDKHHLLCKEHQCEWNLISSMLSARYRNVRDKSKIKWRT